MRELCETRISHCEKKVASCDHMFCYATITHLLKCAERARSTQDSLICKMASISIVGTSRRVVDAPGLTIDELAGNVASSDDRISIAHVK